MQGRRYDDEEEDEEEEQDEEWGAEEERLVQLRVSHAFNIPKVDLLSESDPYVVLQLPGRGHKPCRTSTIQDEPNPVWEEDFFFNCMCLANGRLQGVIDMEVMDEDLISDGVIGKTTLDLERYDPLDWGRIELPLVLVDKVQAMFEKQLKKQQKGGFLSLGRKRASPDLARELAPYVVLSIIGTMPSFSTLQHSLPELPDVVVDPKARMVLVPLPGYPVLAGIQYGNSPRKGPRLCLLSTEAWTILSDGLRLDFQLPSKVSMPQQQAPRAGAKEMEAEAEGAGRRAGQGMSRPSQDSGAGDAGSGMQPSVAAVVERLQFPRGRLLNSNLRIFEEVALVGLPLSADLAEVLVTVAPKLPTVAAYDVCALLTGAGWQGPGFHFKAALSHMRDYVADSSSSKQELYVMTDGEIPPCCVLALDFKDMVSTPMGPTPHIVAYLNKTSDLYWELSREGEAALQAKEVHYARSVTVMKGDSRIRSRRRLQLCDTAGRLACQEDLGGLQLLGYEIDYDNYFTWSLLLALGGDFGAEERPEAEADAAGSIKLLGKIKSSVVGSIQSMLGHMRHMSR